jgi:hypothetical protein
MWGGWEVFGSPPNQFTVRQARCSFNTRAMEPFIPQVTCANQLRLTCRCRRRPMSVGDPGNRRGVDQGAWGDDHVLAVSDPRRSGGTA